MSQSALRNLAAAGALALAALLAACAINPATGEPSFTGFMSESDEARIGRESHPEVLKEFGGAYGTPELQTYISSIGNLLASTSERSNVPFTFTVLNTPVVNAFAVPGGYIYITRGLLALANNEAEVAGVLAHEIGHIAARHSAQRYSQQMLAQIGLMGLGIATGSGELVNLAGTGAMIYLQSYSREQEYEADELGVRYLARANYEPQAMADFLSSLAADSRLEAMIEGHPETADQFNIMATHPRTVDRVQRAVTEAKATTPVPNPITEREIYLDKIDGILYGDDPDQGFIRGQRFAHPKLLFEFTAPDGFNLVNSADAVQASGPKGSGLVFDRAPRSPAGSLTDYIAYDWARKIRVFNLESLTINGMDAATAIASVDTRRGPADLRLVAIRYDAGTVYRFLFLTPPGLTAALDPAFRKSASSFRKLTPAEAAALKPMRVRIITVQQGDSVASLAARMPFPNYREERFRTLNGLAPGQGLVAGQRVKLIVE
jgi:predicted Zn-dependent protease